MPLGQGMSQMAHAVRDRIEVSEGDGVWYVTAGCFESAVGYARERFGEPIVLARQDRSRWWPRVTLTVTTDPARAAEAPDLAELASPAVPEQASPRRSLTTPEHEPHQETATDRAPEQAPDDLEPVAGEHASLPPSLEALFARQEQR